MPSTNTVVPIEFARQGRTMQGENRSTGIKGSTMPQKGQPEDSVSNWVNRGFIALVAVTTTVLLSFGTWLVTNINTISTNTSVMQSRFSAWQDDVSHVKATVDELRVLSSTWATKDALTGSKEEMRRELEKLKDRIQLIELRLAESGPSRPK